MIKRILAVVGAVALAGSIYFSTQVGLRSQGWHDVVAELSKNPGYAAVGQTYSTPDGSRVLVTAVRYEHGKHLVHARIQGTHRYTLALFPIRCEHSFSMDRPSLEWTLRQACGSPAPLGQPRGREWHVLN